MYIHCCNRAELARCVETTVCHNCAQQTGTIDTCQGANAHWAMPHLSGRRSSLLKRVRFGYGSLTNLFSTTLSIQANSRVLTLTVSAKRKPVHSSYRDVTTKSERVIAHVIGSNLLCLGCVLVCACASVIRRFLPLDPHLERTMAKSRGEVRVDLRAILETHAVSAASRLSFRTK